MASKTRNGGRRPTGTETILLVEDEDLVSELAKRILERAGYTVLTAADGREALNLYEKERERISAVILDVILPHMGGKQCLHELRKIDPNVKVLLTSGHPVYASSKEMREFAAKGFVGKPYKIKEMLRAVRDVLDSD